MVVGNSVYEQNGRLVVIAPNLPEGCAKCPEAKSNYKPVKEMFEVIKGLGDVSLAGKNKATMPASVAADDDHRKIVAEYERASDFLNDLLTICDYGAVDEYRDGHKVAIRCGVTNNMFSED